MRKRGWNPFSDRQGSVAILAALLMLPLTLCVGSAVDFARLTRGQAALQDAVDAAALAGAAAYVDSTQSSNASVVALRYFNAYAFASDLTVPSSGVQISSAQGTLPAGGNAYNVTVTATATLSATMMALAKITGFSLQATAVASNPIVVPVFSFGGFGGSAADWNSMYMYGVPLDANGNPQYTTFPTTTASYYEIGSNCNSSSSNYSSSSRCVGQTGAKVSTSQVFPTITATQPLGFELKNVANGLYASSSAGYGNNGYNAPSGSVNVFSSALEAASLSPSEESNYSYTEQVYYKGNYYNVKETTTYPTTQTSSTPNCSLIVEQVDPSNLPTSPPSSGKCFSTSSTTSGEQYAAMSCAKMAGRTFMYWWNDMGGPSDDGDYNDAYFTVSCSFGNAATITTSTNASTATSGLAVILSQ